jgi:putative membrane protein
MFRKIFLSCAAGLLAVLGASAANAEDGGLNDLQIAHIAYTADEIDIQYAKLALECSDNADVRAFAETMIRDHTAVNVAALALLEKLGASPEDNPTSQSLLASAAAKRTELKALKGAEFDRAYAANELAYHQFVNKTVEGTFIPAVQNAEFKQFLSTALVTFKTHEGHAEKLVKKLGK